MYKEEQANIAKKKKKNFAVFNIITNFQLKSYSLGDKGPLKSINMHVIHPK